MWAQCTPTKPPPLAECAAIFAVNTVANSSLVKAEQAALRPIVDYSSVRGLDAGSSFLPLPTDLSKSKSTKKLRFSLDTKRGELAATPDKAEVSNGITSMHGIGTEAVDLSSIAHLTTTERSIIQMHIKHQDNPEFAVEFVLPSGKTVTYKAMPGAGPGLDSIAMPTLPGPTTYKAAMLTENWREWLRLFIAEIEGQIDAGCFHWTVLPEGHKLLNPVVVFTQKLHVDFTYERGKARVCVDDSRGKPGEYADVCAHVAQLSTCKYQVAVRV
jgi:hypothetical protein